MKQYAIYVCGGRGPLLPDEDSDCPRRADHEPVPRGYLQHAEWAEEKLRTHRCERCPGCGLWKIWVPR